MIHRTMDSHTILYAVAKAFVKPDARIDNIHVKRCCTSTTIVVVVLFQTHTMISSPPLPDCAPRRPDFNRRHAAFQSTLLPSPRTVVDALTSHPSTLYWPIAAAASTSIHSSVVISYARARSAIRSTKLVDVRVPS